MKTETKRTGIGTGLIVTAAVVVILIVAAGYFIFVPSNSPSTSTQSTTTTSTTPTTSTTSTTTTSTPTTTSTTSTTTTTTSTTPTTSTTTTTSTTSTTTTTTTSTTPTTSTTTTTTSSSGPVVYIFYPTGIGANPSATVVPTTITVVPGTTVVFVNNDTTSIHDVNVTAPSGVTLANDPSTNTNKWTPSGGFTQTYSFVLTTAGTYTFKCDYHSWMKGTITVT